MSIRTDQKPTHTKRDSWLDKPVFSFWPTFSIEKLLIIILLILTLFSRFYDLGERVMSHDEVNHVVPAFDLYQGRGYRYDPVTHGPFQFHMVALSYFLFGDSDFSARIPAALFGVAIVIFTVFAWRRYLGRIGALIGGFLFTISPYMLFYSRYTRNEIFIVFWGVVMLWLMLRYLECGKQKTLLWLAAIIGLHYADKATSYIFTAEALIFLAILFVFQVVKIPWKRDLLKIIFFGLLVFTILTASIGLILFMRQNDSGASVDASSLSGSGGVFTSDVLMYISLGLALLALIAILVILVMGVGLAGILKLRSFDLLVLQISLVLPLLSAMLIKIMGFDPLDYSQTGILRSLIAIIPLTLLSVVIGVLWNRKSWWKCALIFWSIFTIFYTTVFTRGDGFFVGLLGGLGYWMSQQDVQRGTQPLYYYAMVQIPIYEFLPAIGTVLALIIGIAKGLLFSKAESPFERTEKPEVPDTDQIFEKTPAEETLDASVSEEQDGDVLLSELIQENMELSGEKLTDTADFPETGEEVDFIQEDAQATKANSLPTLFLLLFWSLISLIAFTLAGERMPWLTTHIAMPLILSAAWGLGYLVESTDWKQVFQKKGVLVFLCTGLLVIAAANAAGSLLGDNPPFQGKELVQLQATSQFLLSAIISIASWVSLVFLLRNWKVKLFLKTLVVVIFISLGIITTRSAFRAAFINYDNAKEFLVYAHATRDMKDVLEQVETISKRLYGDKSIDVAYDNNSLYPFWWYFRDYPNKRWFGDTPTRDLRNSPIILVGTENFEKIAPVVADDYYRFDYIRMWWPIEDYRNQTFQSLWDMLKNPEMRSALWQIWFNRDYTRYAEVTGKSFLTLSTWSPSDLYRMYIKKDIAAQIWEYGLTPEPQVPKVDPYALGTISLDAEKVILTAGGTPFSSPRDIAIAPDGSLYIADSRNHRIVHLSAEGELIKSWGTYANVLDGNAPGGTFNEPWGITVDEEGYVYVADTWNHRIQKFSPDGQFITLWDTFGAVESPDGFWGPRGIAVDTLGRILVTDTGKQRVVVFSDEGEYITQFGGIGLLEGKLDEPVGIAVDADGLVYVADTWNKRIQVFAPSLDFMNYTSILSWEVDAWSSQSLENKPFLALNQNKQVFITDPDLGRILQFGGNGTFLQLWGGFDNAILIGTASGIEVTADGKVWVSDALNNSLLLFSPPEIAPSIQEPSGGMEGEG